MRDPLRAGEARDHATGRSRSGATTAGVSRTDRTIRSVLAALALAVAAVLVVLVGASPADAHASLASSDPSDGAVVAAPPDIASFTFNEPVSMTTGALRVYDATGTRVDDGVLDQPAEDTVGVGLESLAAGGYVATYRVTSDDGHVIRGAVTFAVGDGPAVDDQTVAALFAGRDGVVVAAATVVRAIDLGAALVAVGAMAALAGMVVTDRHRRVATDTSRRAALTGSVAAAVTIPLQATASSGLGVAALVSTEVVADTITGTVGVSALTRIAGLVLVLAAVQRGRDSRGGPGPRSVGPGRGAWTAVGAGVLVLGSFLLDGHTRTVGPAAVMLTGDAVHLGAGAVWIGGLVVLARILFGMGGAGDGPRGQRSLPVGVGAVAADPVGPGGDRALGATGPESASVVDRSGVPRATTTVDGPPDLDARSAALDVDTSSLGARVSDVGTRTIADGDRGVPPAIRHPAADPDPVAAADPDPVAGDDPDPMAGDGPRTTGVDADADVTADDPHAVAAVVARFSGWALWAMLALVAAGSAMAWALVRQPRALVTTDQGWTLVVKVGIVAAILLVAAWNRWRLVPAVAGADPDGADPAVGMAHLRSSVRVEVVLLAAVLATTAVLVALRPAAEEAGISGAFDTVVALGDDASLNLVVDPNRAGRNEVHVYVLDDTGRPLAEATDVTMDLEQVEADIGPLERTPRAAGPGHWILDGSDLAVPGRWEITTVVGLGRFSQVQATVEVVVNPG